MKEDYHKKIQELMAGIQCSKDFQCAKSGFERLCKAKDIGLENYLECLEENSQPCPFVQPFGNGRFCQCPLRVYLAKKLEK